MIAVMGSQSWGRCDITCMDDLITARVSQNDGPFGDLHSKFIPFKVCLRLSKMSVGQKLSFYIMGRRWINCKTRVYDLLIILAIPISIPTHISPGAVWFHMFTVSHEKESTP